VILSRHALHDFEQRGLAVSVALLSAEGAEIPVITAHHLVERERVLRPCGENHASPVVVVHRERVAVAAPPDFELASPGRDSVGARIGREQHPHATFGVGTQHHDVTILRNLDVDSRTLAPNEAVGAQRDLDWRIIIGTRNRWVCSGPDRR
jgi:hypothetical protein